MVSVLISGDLKSPMTLYAGFIQLGAGLSVGLAGLAAGFAIGIVGDAGVRGTAQQPRLYIGMILILIFAEVLGLYGLIVALILNTRSQDAPQVRIRLLTPLVHDSGLIPSHPHNTDDIDKIKAFLYPHIHPEAACVSYLRRLRA